MAKRRTFSPQLKAEIVLEILKEEKPISEISSQYEIHAVQLNRWKKEAIENFSQLFVDDRKGITKMKNDYEKTINDLYAEVGKLTTQLAWIKKNLASSQTRGERLDMIEWEDSELSLTTQAELLSLNRSSLYYKPVPPSPEEVAHKHRIDEIYTQYPFMGSRRIAALMNSGGVNIHRNTVQKYMREMGLAAIYPGPNLSKRNLEHRIYPYLLRNLTIEKSNHVWGIDITYIRMPKGWMYLVAILDWYSRYVVSWELDQTLEMPFVLEALKQALKQAKPVIMNSDQGSHFTSSDYIDMLKSTEIQISMDGRGRALDNVFTERLWRSVKYEEVYLHEYESPRQARQRINAYFDFYNTQRPHQSLGYETPATVYFQH